MLPKMLKNTVNQVIFMWNELLWILLLIESAKNKLLWEFTVICEIICMAVNEMLGIQM